jgi:hypothetical protein
MHDALLLLVDDGLSESEFAKSGIRFGASVAAATRVQLTARRFA